MNAVEFVKKYGWASAKYYLGTASNDAVMISFNMPEYGFERITLNAIDLKRLVESWELVEKVGGLTMAKHFYKNFECIHIGLDLIQCRNLGKAIADVESVGGGV